MTEPIEVEVKFICPSDLNLEALEKVLREAGLAVAWRQPVEQVDVYLDTPDRTLLSAEASLRVRRIGEQYVGTFKTPKGQAEGLFRRGELEWDLSPNDVQAWERGGLPNFPETVLKLLEVSSLSRLITASTLRHKALVEGEGELLLELAIDEVTFTGARGKARQRELELELKRGDAEEFTAIASALQKQFTLTPSTKSKFAVGMELVG